MQGVCEFCHKALCAGIYFDSQGIYCDEECAAKYHEIRLHDHSFGGTPKTLEEAIARALAIGPLSSVRERLYGSIRDFCAQKFTVAEFAQMTPAQLWEMIFGKIDERQPGNKALEKLLDVLDRPKQD